MEKKTGSDDKSLSFVETAYTSDNMTREIATKINQTSVGYDEFLKEDRVLGYEPSD